MKLLTNTVRRMRYQGQLYLFIVPAAVLIGLFQYYPAGSGVYHSFFRWNGADISEYVGIDNYRDLAQNTAFWQSFKTAGLLGLFSIAKMVPAIAVAVCIHRCRSARMQFLYRLMFVVPMVVPGLIIVLIWRSFFFDAISGYLNHLLFATGLIDALAWLDRTFDWGGTFASGERPAWLGDPRLILVACVLWGFPWVGSFAVLTYLARLQNIPLHIYEAAEIDGIGWWQKFTHIELPLIMGSIGLLLVLVVVETLKDAGMILALAGFEGGPGGAVTVPALFMIRKAFIEQQMGYACAVGIVLTVAVLVLQKVGAFALKAGSTRKRRFLKLVLLLTATCLLLAGAPWLSLATAACILPYGQLRGLLAAPFAPRTLEDYRRLQQQRVLRAADPSVHRRRVIGTALLRALRHGFILLVLVLALLPVYLMLVISFKNNAQFYQAPLRLTAPYHTENWSSAVTFILPSLANSLFVSIASTALTLVIAVAGAYFFARRTVPGQRLLWNCILILLMMPAIANLVPLYRLLRDMNLLNTLAALILVLTSGGLVFAIFVLRGFVADLPKDLFEAADMDGASHFTQLRVIVLPLAGPILGTVGVMHFLASWNEFVLPLIIMRDQSRLPVMVQLLRMAGEYIKLWGPLMAGYSLASLPVILLFLFTMKLFVRGLAEGALKE